MTFEHFAVVIATAILLLFADFFDCRQLRQKNSELTAQLLNKEDQIIELNRRLIRAWWDAMEEAASIAHHAWVNGTKPPEVYIRERIQERVIK